MSLIHPVGMFGGGKVYQPAPPEEKTTAWVLGTAVRDNGGFTSANNALADNDNVATYTADGGTTVAITIGAFTGLSLPANTVPIGLDMQVRWRVDTVNSDTSMSANYIYNISANIRLTSDFVGSASPASAFQNTVANAHFIEWAAYGSINEIINGNHAVTAEWNVSNCTLSVAWIKVRLRYLQPAPGNSLVWTPKRYAGSAAQAALDELPEPGEPFTNIANATGAPNGTYATSVVPKNGWTQGLRLTNFGFSLADVIPVALVAWPTEGTGADGFRFDWARMLSPNGVEGLVHIPADRPAVIGSDRPIYHGGFWGIANLTLADINSSALGWEFMWRNRTIVEDRTYNFDALGAQVLYSTV